MQIPIYEPYKMQRFAELHTAAGRQVQQNAVSFINFVYVTQLQSAHQISDFIQSFSRSLPRGKTGKTRPEHRVS